MQAIVIRATGWTIAEYLDQPMGDVFALVRNLAEEPPEYRILAWRYLQPKASRSRGTTAPVKKEETRELSTVLGMPAQPVPRHIRERFEWAQKELEKFGRGKKSSRTRGSGAKGSSE